MKANPAYKGYVKGYHEHTNITIDADKSFEEAMAILNEHKINRLPVVYDSSIIGIVTTGIIMSNVSIEKHADTEFLNSF